MSRDLGSIQQESTQILILAGSGIRGLDDTDLIYSWKDGQQRVRVHKYST